MVRLTKVSIEALENRFAPAGSIIATGAGFGGGPNIRVFDAETAVERASFFAFDESFTGGVRVATGDMNGDGIADYIAGAGPGAGPSLRIFSGKDLSLLADFSPYNPNFRGGIFVSAGNFDADPELEIATGAGAGGSPHVRVFNYLDGVFTQLPGPLGSFFAYDPLFQGGVTVAANNFDGDFGDELITGPGAGGAPHVKVFHSNGATLVNFFAYNQNFLGGVNLALGDLNRDGKSEIITGAGPGGGPAVGIFNGGNGTQLRAFYAYDSLFTGGVNVSLTDMDFNGFPEIVTSAGPGGGPEVRVWNSATTTPVLSFNAFNDLFRGGVFSSGTVRSPGSLNGSFMDPTAEFLGAANTELGHDVYIAPFTLIDASKANILIGNESNVQDNVVLITTTEGDIEIGDEVILAHGSSVYGPATIGKVGGLPSFVGFNSVIDGAIIEEDAFVGHLAKVGPGIIIHAGTKVKNGMFISTQAQADDPSLGKVAEVTQGERNFMIAVLDVNVDLAKGYNELYFSGGILAVLGINLNPISSFNPVESLPTLAGIPQSVPEFRNRIIGNVVLANTLAELNLVMGNRDSLRADEGPEFDFGSIAKMGDRFTAHALEHTGITVGNNNQFGSHTLIHGGEDTGASVQGSTLGDNIRVGDWSVVFRSTIQDNVTIGFRSFIDNSLVKEGTVVLDREIIINNIPSGFVEW